MHHIEVTHKTKQKKQSMMKVLLWLGAFLVLLITIQQIAYTKTPLTNRASSNNQTKDIESQSVELSEEAKRLEATLNELHFEDDIRALRDQ